MAVESSEDSPFDSGSEDSSDDERLSEGEFTVSGSGSELSQVSEDEENVHYGDGDNPRAGSDDGHGSGDSVSDDDNNDVESVLDETENSREVLDESDSSEDEVAPRNTVGDVPREWYLNEGHIGYDLSGKKIKKKERQSKLDSFLASVDDSKNWRKIYDDYNDEEVELTKQPYVDWFAWDGARHPISNAPEPKRRFIPSKWESKRVLRYVRAIRKGLIKFDDKRKKEPQFYGLWDDDSTADRQGLAYIPAPKPKLPGSSP